MTMPVANAEEILSWFPHFRAGARTACDAYYKERTFLDALANFYIIN